MCTNSWLIMSQVFQKSCMPWLKCYKYHRCHTITLMRRIQMHMWSILIVFLILWSHLKSYFLCNLMSKRKRYTFQMAISKFMQYGESPQSPLWIRKPFYISMEAECVQVMLNSSSAFLTCLPFEAIPPFSQWTIDWWDTTWQRGFFWLCGSLWVWVSLKWGYNANDIVLWGCSSTTSRHWDIPFFLM